MAFGLIVSTRPSSLQRCRGVAGRRRPRAGAAMAAIFAACGMVFAAAAHAEPSGTVKVRTQRMSQPASNSRQDGWYNVNDRLTLVCSTRGQATRGLSHSTTGNGDGNALWYKTSDGYFVNGADVETATLNAFVPDCAGQGDRGAAPSTNAGRAMGQHQPTNSGTEGQCTWGALNQWFEAGGYYPSLAGNASDWADSARAHGWTVVTDPQPRAIVVFQPWLPGVSPYGHAAWVNSVTERFDGTWINIIEMNNSSHGGAGAWWTRDVKNVPGMSYILMP